MSTFDNLALGRKLALLVGIVVLCATAASFAVADLMRSELFASRLDQLRAVTDAAKGLAASLQAQVAAGEISRDEAIKAFGARANAMTYNGGQGYVFAYTMDGVAIAMSDASQIGTNRLDSLVNGRHVNREIRDAVQATGDAVIRYDFPRPGTSAAVPKISVATRFAPWNIFLGTGAYIDDLDAKFWNVILTFGAGLAVFLVVVGGLAALIARRITRPLDLLRRSMTQLSSGDLGVDVPGTGRRDEVGAMADAVLVFKDNARHARALEQEQREASARRLAEDEAMRRRTEADAAAAAAALVVDSIGKGLEALATGNLTVRLETALPAAYEKLRTDFNAAMEQLAELIRTIISVTVAVDSGSGEIARAADDLNRRTEQQAASLEQTAAAADQLFATVRRTAENAVSVSHLVKQTKTDATQSGEIVHQAIAAMGGIERSSREISQIIGVIDDIAFQTNLLALNAGVEAARAGESGRGFAVVASEVRALAQRSADAAKQIKALIANSASEVSAGVDLVNGAGTSLERIVAQVAEITGLIADMAASAEEQATGLREVNAAVNQMDQMTQQNAAMVEESTAACHTLGGETSELLKLTRRFTVDPRDTRSDASVLLHASA